MNGYGRTGVVRAYRDRLDFAPRGYEQCGWRKPLTGALVPMDARNDKAALKGGWEPVYRESRRAGLVVQDTPEETQ